MKPTTSSQRLAYAWRLAFTDPGLLAAKLAWRARAFGRPRTGDAIARVLGEIEMRFALDDGGPIWHMRYGGYDIELVRLMRRVIRRGDTVIDVGANVGYTAAVAAALVGPEGSVHAFEPEPRLHAALVDLAGRNPRHRVVANACALGAERGEATLAVSGDNIGWNTLVPAFLTLRARRIA